MVSLVYSAVMLPAVLQPLRLRGRCGDRERGRWSVATAVGRAGGRIRRASGGVGRRASGRADGAASRAKSRGRPRSIGHDG